MPEVWVAGGAVGERHAVEGVQLHGGDRSLVGRVVDPPVDTRCVQRADDRLGCVGVVEQVRAPGGYDGIALRHAASRSLVIWGDQLIRRGPLRPLKRLLLHSPLMVWAPFASNVYHDMIWYPTVGRARIGDFMRTEWGTLFKKY